LNALSQINPASGIPLAAKRERKQTMIAFLDQQPPSVIPKPPRPNLLLHCGARAVERKDVQCVATPRATDTWTPIPHLELVTQVERTLKANSLVVGTQAHSLTHDGARYFGLMEIQRTESAEDYYWVCATLTTRRSRRELLPAPRPTYAIISRFRGR
jgi:hypothetical protein